MEYWDLFRFFCAAHPHYEEERRDEDKVASSWSEWQPHDVDCAEHLQHEDELRFSLQDCVQGECLQHHASSKIIAFKLQ